MKNLKITLFCSILIASSLAQNEDFRPYYNEGEPWQFQKFNYDESVNLQDSLIKINGIETKKAYIIDKNGKKKLTSVTTFDENNSFQLYNLTHRKVSYRDHFKSNSHKIYHWKTWGKNNSQYNTYQQIGGKQHLSSKIVTRKNRLVSSHVYFWNTKGEIDSVQYFRKNSSTASSVVHYTYKNGRLAETKTFEKGKLKAIRKYDCEPLGEVEKKIKTSKTCKNVEFDANGNKIEVTEYTDNKGNIRKYKKTYVGESERVFRTEGFDHKNRPTYLTEKTDTSDIYVSYNNNGKVTWKTEKKLKNGQLIERIYSRKGRETNRTSFSYSATGELIFKTSSTKGKVGYKEIYSYNSNGLMTKKMVVRKKKTSTFVYEYF